MIFVHTFFTFYTTFSHIFSVYLFTLKANAFHTTFSHQIGRQVKTCRPLLVYGTFYILALLIRLFLFFLLKLTRIMSLPIWHTSQNGITYSFSLPKNPQIHPGPGTTSAVIQPVFSSNSRSPTYPGGRSPLY